MDGTPYREGKGSDAFEALVKSLRKGDVVRVFRPFLLAPAKGSPAKRRRAWADRAERIKARGGCLRAISEPELKGAKLAMYAYEEIAGVARGRAGQAKKGRPKLAFPDPVMRIIERKWPPRKGQTWNQAVDEINQLIAPHEVTRGWLYANVK